MRRTKALGTEIPARHHGHHDFVKLFLELEDQLNTRDFVSGAEINGFRGIDEIHGVLRDRESIPSPL